MNPHIFLLFIFCSFFAQSCQNIMTVKIGDQVWMVENLNVDNFRNGDPIPEAKTKEEWRLAGENKQPAWCYYDNDPSNGTKYGKLYNWYAVNDSRGLAPQGLHIPTETEWTELSNNLGGEEVAGAKMKSTSGWNRMKNSIDQSGFSGSPGGARNYNGAFDNIGYYGYWWSSKDNSTSVAWCRYLSNGQSVDRGIFNKNDGLSVRCLKD